MSNDRPYPEGPGWDEALRQRQRADKAETITSGLIVFIMGVIIENQSKALTLPLSSIDSISPGDQLACKSDEENKTITASIVKTMPDAKLQTKEDAS